MDATSGGRPTVRRLDRRLNTCKASSLPSMFEGIGPKSPIAGSRSSRTRFPSGVHVTPTQDVQTWVVRVQLIFFPCGRDAANARRACLSEFRSAPLVQGRSGNKREAERKAISLRCCIVRMARRTRRTRTTITQGSPSVLQSSEEKKNIPRASLTTGDTPLALCSSPWQTKTLTPRTTADAPRAAPGRKRIPTFRGRAKQPTAPSPLASGAESRSHGPGIAPTNSSIHPKTARIPPPSSAP